MNMQMQKERTGMSQTEIDIHFEQMKLLSEELSQTAENLIKAVNTTGMEALSGTKASWISPNADIFAGKEIRLMERMEAASDNLKSLAGEVLKKAEQIYALEQRNALTARARRYR